MSGKRVLGLDLGPTSIGWGMVEDSSLIACGVRIFPEGVQRDQKTGGEVPKNQDRRVKRGMRRQVARRARRKRVLREALISIGMLPEAAGLPRNHPSRCQWEAEAFSESEIYELRRRALDDPLSLHELGRIFLHLSQRRGFLSNRKADRARKNEEKGMLAEISERQAAIQKEGSRTLGEHLARMRAGQPHMRVRGLHTRRQMFLDEFNAIWDAQSRHHPDLLTDALKFGSQERPQDQKADYPCTPVPTGGPKCERERARRRLARFGLHGLIFFQRPMYWPKSVIGQCELNPREKRCPRAHRAAQEFRMLLEVNNLHIIRADGETLPLSEEQRESLLGLLSRKDSATFDDIRKKLDLREDDGFNLEAGDRRKLQGMATDARLAGSKLLGKSWWKRTETEKNAIVASLLEDEEANFLRNASEKWGIARKVAERLLTVALPQGYSSYGLSTIEKLLPHLRRGLPLLSRDDSPCAVRLAGFLPPWERAKRIGEALLEPPAVTNPIVRQALFEVRKLVNAIVREHGKPDAIHVEMAREIKGNAIQRKRMMVEMRARERAREKAARAIEEFGDTPTRRKIERYLLWQEQREMCMYSGKTISMTQLMTGEADIDHILPYSKSLDDSLMNKVICFREENAAKKQDTVYQWLAETQPEKYTQVLQRAARLPIEVRNRKLPRFSQKTCALEHFVNRQLNDTAYISAIVLNYLSALGVDLVGSKGALTAELRQRWGLNTVLHPESNGYEKNREDHRHHAVDAIVVALTNRSRLQQLARRSDESLEVPWPTFREDVERAIMTVKVSHRANRKISGALHEETLYGATQKAREGSKQNRGHAKDWIEEEGVYVLRKPLESLSLNEVDKIRDIRVREVVQARLKQFGLVSGRKKDKDADAEEASAPSGRKIPKEVWREPLYLVARNGKAQTATPIRKVRLIKPEKSIVPLGKPDAGPARFVKPGNLHHVAIFETTEDKGKVRRHAHFVSMLEAARRVRDREPIIQVRHPMMPDARFVMSLSRGEMVLGIFKGKERLVRFSTAASTQGQLYFIDHTDARPSATVAEFAVKASTLNGKKVHVDLLGRIHPAND